MSIKNISDYILLYYYSIILTLNITFFYKMLNYSCKTNQAKK